MHCQLDEVKQILDTAAAIRDAVQKNLTKDTPMGEFSRRAASITCGMLLINEHDVFIQKGRVNLRGKESPHYWVEVYLDGEPFILDAVLPFFAGEREGGADVLFLPAEEAAGMYGYGPGEEYPWRREDCEEGIWLEALRILRENKPLDLIFQEISEYAL